jgi:hypothetical protein
MLYYDTKGTIVRYRYQTRTDMLFLEIKFVLTQFAGPLLELLKVIKKKSCLKSNHILLIRRLFLLS